MIGPAIKMPDEMWNWLQRDLKPYGLSLLQYHDSFTEMWKGLIYHGLVRLLYDRKPETRRIHYYEALRMALREELQPMDLTKSEKAKRTIFQIEVRSDSDGMEVTFYRRQKGRFVHVYKNLSNASLERLERIFSNMPMWISFTNKSITINVQVKMERAGGVR